jgi:hypothetical protein
MKTDIQTQWQEKHSPFQKKEFLESLPLYLQSNHKIDIWSKLLPQTQAYEKTNKRGSRKKIISIQKYIDVTQKSNCRINIECTWGVCRRNTSKQEHTEASMLGLETRNFEIQHRVTWPIEPVGTYARIKSKPELPENLS